MGEKTGSPVNLVVSTVKEAENLVPLLKEYQAAGRAANASLAPLPTWIASICS